MQTTFTLDLRHKTFYCIFLCQGMRDILMFEGDTISAEESFWGSTIRPTVLTHKQQKEKAAQPIAQQQTTTRRNRNLTTAHTI